MCLRRPISFSFTGGISARFFALRGLAVEDREALPVGWPLVRDMINLVGQRK